MLDGRMAEPERTGVVRFTFDGEVVAAYRGDTVASALWAAGHRAVRRSSTGHEPRGVFCAMGICFECLVRIDGREVRSCMAAVRDGLVVESGGR